MRGGKKKVKKTQNPYEDMNFPSKIKGKTIMVGNIIVFFRKY